MGEYQGRTAWVDVGEALLKKVICIYIIIGLVLLLAGCNPEQPEPVQTQGFALGTIIDQKVYGADAQAAVQQVEAMIEELDGLWTINSPGGDINKLNDNAGQGFVELDPRTIDILTQARQISELSDGEAFDITVGPLVKAWGIGTDHPQVLTGDIVRQLTVLVNYRDVQIDTDSNSARLVKKGQMVDLGGIAKGYIGDKAVDIYEQHGISSAFINLGGNVAVLGSKPDGSPWRVGIQNPRGVDGEIIGVVEVIDRAVVSSGDYQRFFINDGHRYSHILDPKTGYPADSGLMSVTIIAPSSTAADGLSKALVLGLERGMKLVEDYGGAEAIFITTDKKIYLTPGIESQFHLEDASHEYTLVQNR